MGKKAVSRLFYYISIVGTAFIACLAIAGALSKFLSPIDNNSLTLFGLFLPAILIVNVLMLLYWLIRFRFWVFIPIIAIATNYSYLMHVFQFPHNEGGKYSSMKQFTIGTYNVHSFNGDPYGYFCKGARTFMKSQEADIICFQEFGINPEFNQDSLRATLDDWKYSLIPKPKNNQPILQLAVFSKYPILRGEYFTYSDSKNTALWIDLDIQGDTIRLFNIHLQTTSVSQTKGNVVKEMKKESFLGVKAAVRILTEDMEINYIKRAYQANYIAKVISESPYPTILCGDFNSIPSSYAYRTIKGKTLIDGFLTAGHGYMYTYKYFKHLFRIDYILTSKEFKGVDYYSWDLDYSDHNPVVMKIAF